MRIWSLAFLVFASIAAVFAAADEATLAVVLRLAFAAVVLVVLVVAALRSGRRMARYEQLLERAIHTSPPRPREAASLHPRPARR